MKTVENLYHQKDYLGALQTLEANKGKISADLWNYNMGAVHGGLQNWPQARFHLLKAEKEGFSSQELTQNLELVESKLEIGRFEKPTSTYDYLVRGSLTASDGILTSLALLILVIGLVKLKKEESMRALGALMGIVLFILGINWWICTWPMVVVTKPQMIYEGPSAIFSAREELPLGLVLIAKPEGKWIQVLYPSRFQGWIKKEGLKEL